MNYTFYDKYRDYLQNNAKDEVSMDAQFYVDTDTHILPPLAGGTNTFEAASTSPLRTLADTYYLGNTSEKADAHSYCIFKYKKQGEEARLEGLMYAAKIKRIEAENRLVQKGRRRLLDELKEAKELVAAQQGMLEKYREGIVSIKILLEELVQMQKEKDDYAFETIATLSSLGNTSPPSHPGFRDEQ
jgi:hypothetical protein